MGLLRFKLQIAARTHPPLPGSHRSRVRKQNLIVQPDLGCLPGHGVERFPALVIAAMLLVEQILEIDAAVRANLMKEQVVCFE
jgi:hypothetical protein